MDDASEPLMPRRRRRRRASPPNEAAVLATPTQPAEADDPAQSVQPTEPPAERESAWPDADDTQVVAAVAVPSAAVSTVRRDADLEDALADRRRILWRDSATILIGVIIAILAYQTFAPPSAGEPTGSGTPIPSGIVIGTLPPPISLPPGVTFGPIIDPSLGVDATPTPIPVITLGPSPSPSPSPEPSASLKPSPKPSAKPPTAPPPTPVVTPAPPVAQFTWSTSGLEVTFENSSTGDTGWTWDFGELGSSPSSEQNPSHTYLAPGDYTVTLTVSGPGGSDSVSHTVSVSLG